MTDEPRDRELEKAYREASDEAPPPELDARILAAAHRAVGAKPQPATKAPGWLDRYRVPLSIAATVVLATTLTVMVRDESERGADGVPVLSAPTRATPSSAPPAVTPSPAPPPAAPRAVEALKAAPSGASTANEQKARADVPRTPDAAPRLEERRAESLRKMDRLVPAAEPSTANVAPPAAAGSLAGPSPPPALQEAPADQLRAAPAPAMRAPAPAAAPLSRERELADRPERAERSFTTPVARDATRTPEQWLADIRRLVAAGHDVEARIELEAFVRANPRFPLPADLQPLVP
jgi:hypothetical protein